jgi:hypothetical protein
VPFDAAQLGLALAAFERYRKGINPDAWLNLGDCCSYALAKSLDLPLLFKGTVAERLLQIERRLVDLEGSAREMGVTADHINATLIELRAKFDALPGSAVCSRRWRRPSVARRWRKAARDAYGFSRRSSHSCHASTTSRCSSIWAARKA